LALFLDTSALLAVLDACEQRHARAQAAWVKILGRREQVVTTNYVLVESFALVQRRLGVDAVRVLQTDILPVIQVEWVDQPLHQAGVAALLSAGRRGLSLVDCVSFEVMRRLALRIAFAFDEDFAEQGFRCIP
jgi:predicted nucleic acid-binding protein